MTIDPQFKHDVLETFVVCFLVALIALAASEAYGQREKVRADRAEERARLAEANLLGCLNGGYTGVHYFKGNQRVDIVCPRGAEEIK